MGSSKRASFCRQVSKRREWNDVAAQMGLKLEAGPCLKLLHAKYLLNLEALLGDLSPPSQAPKAMSLPEQGPQKTRSSSTCTSERGQGRLKESGRDFGRGDEREPVSQGGGEGERHSGGGDERDRRSGGDDDVRTTLPSLRAVSEGSLGQHAESEECMETDATSSACSLKVEEVTGGTKEGLREGFGAFQAGLEEVSGGVKVGFGTLQRDGLQNYEGVSQGARESLAGVREDLLKGLGAGVRGEISKGERVSIDLGPETSVEGSLLTDAIPSVRSAGGKRSLTESELFGGVSFIESLAVRKSGVYGSGSVSEVSGSADVAGARGEGNAEPLAVPTGEGAVPTARDQNGGANLLEDDPAQPVGVPDWRRGVAEGGPVPFPGDESSFRGFGGLRALTVSLQGLDGLGPQDASELEHWLGENRRNDSTVSWGEQRPAHTPANPTTLSPQRLQLIQNPSPRKMHLSPRMMNPSPRNLTLSPSKWMHSLSGQKRKAGLLCATQFGGVEDAGFVQGLETPEAKRRREVATGHPLRRPRGYRPLTSYADPVPPQLTATVTALQEQLQRHRENWLVVRLESVAEEGRRTRTKLVEEELEYLQPRIGSRFQASVPEWRPFMGAKTVAQTVLHPSGDLATPPGDDLLTSEATWISRLVWRPLQEPTAAEEERVAVPVMVADPRLTRPSLRRTSSQSDGAAVRKQLVSDARSALEVTLGGAGGDLGLTEMGERVAGKWSRAEEQRFVATAGSIRRGKDVSEDFFGEGFFRAIREAVPERLLTELVSYYYNVYKVRCKRGVVRLKGGLGKVDVDGAAKPPGTVQSAGAERDQVLDAGPRGSAFESRGARATDLYVED